MFEPYSLANKKPSSRRMRVFAGASDEARTRYLHLGKVALYQMSYTRSDRMYITTALRGCQGFFSFFSGAVFYFCRIFWKTMKILIYVNAVRGFMV